MAFEDFAKSEKQVRIGRQTPNDDRRVCQDSVQSLMDNPLIEKKLILWGITLITWQKYILRDGLALNGDGTMVYKNIGYTIPRQNGKTEVILARMFLGCILFDEQQLYTAHLDKSARAIFNRAVKMIQRNRELSRYFSTPGVSYSKSDKSKELFIEARDPRTGVILGKCVFGTRGGDPGRGQTIDVLYYDEAQEMTEDQHNSLSATVATKTNGQSYYVGTASSLGDADDLGRTGAKVNSKTFFLTFRANVLKDRPLTTSWSEWGVSKITSRSDIDAMYEANPSLGFKFPDGNGLTVAYLQSQVGKSDEAFATEHLGYWPSQSKGRAIDITAWHDLGIDSIPAPVDLGKAITAMCIKSNLAKDRIDIAVAIKTANQTFVEIVETFSIEEAGWDDRLWLATRDYLKAKSCKALVIDGLAGQFEIQKKFSENGFWNFKKNKFRQGKVYLASAVDMAQASSLLITSIANKSISHTNQDLLDSAVEDAGKRSIKSSGGSGFQSLSGKVDVNYLETAALAIHAVSKQKDITDSTGDLPAGWTRPFATDDDD